MLNTYEAIYDNQSVTFLKEKPAFKKAKVFITVLNELPQNESIMDMCGSLSDEDAGDMTNAINSDCEKILLVN